MTWRGGLRRARGRAALGVGLALLLGWSLAPYLWLGVTSVKPAAELAELPPVFPTRIAVESYARVFTDRPFLRILGNSFLVATAATFLSLAIGGLAAFVLARLRVRGTGLILGLFLSVSMFPQIAIVSPVFLAIKALGLRDTHAGLVLPYTALGLPLTVWFLTGFFRRIPRDLYRAALVDGCTPLVALRRILLPLAAPGIGTTAILNFIFAWNELLFALTLTATARSRTVPVEIALFAGLHEVPWGEIAAASIIATLPLIVVVLVLQRWILAGLLSGATTG